MTPPPTKLLLSLTLLVAVLGDVYLQNPRGSNNRLDEETANRKTANRLFDSQNNEKGGYNTGDRLDNKAGSRPQRQYSMQYYGSGGASSEDSKLLVEWTNQHGCGGDTEKVNCNVVIQYMCHSNGTDDDYPTSSSKDIWKRTLYMRDGTSSSQQSYEDPDPGDSDRDYEKRMERNYKSNVKHERGLHETVWWYDSCRYREANGGLFTADRDLEKDDVGYVTTHTTRQNENGDRNGYECPEERDYFPYWSPTLQMDELDEYQRTPWIDVAWLGDTSKCKYIKDNSFNQNSKFRCVQPGQERSYTRAIDEKACDKEDGKWVEFASFIEVLEEADSRSKCESAARKDKRNKIVWGKLRSDSKEEHCIVQAPELTCREAPSTRVNHLGNPDSNQDGQSKMPQGSRFEWELPHFPSGDAKRCVLRVRYNISTGDYDPWNTFSDSNDDDDVIEDDPEIDVLGNDEEFDTALNTAQTGRTFQDRSHVFVVLPRLNSMADKKIYNLNVRGKRGNIVQTFPATEYDFIPNELTVSRNDLVHVQWTGSNSHDNNNDGDDGEGDDGTDRHNFLEASDLKGNYPKKLKDADFWSGVRSLTDTDADGDDIAVGLASSGFYCGKQKTDNCPTDRSLQKKRKLDGTLDDAPASYFGHVLKFSKAGTLKYLCSRNNNFSNRSQKGKLKVN